MAQTQVTLTLSDELYKQALRWSAITRRDLAQTLTDVLSAALTPVYMEPRLEKPVSSLSDEQVLALTKAKMRPEQGERMERLLEKQREGQLAEEEHGELLALMQIYDQLWIRQSEALAEARERGLLGPMRS